MSAGSLIPKELDWVAKRAACNIGQVFDELCESIARDVAALNSAKRLHEDYQFVVNPVSVGNTIIIGQLGASTSARVVVRIGIVGEEIEVQDGATNSRWRAAVSLNDEGRCTLRIDGDTQLEQWQFRKKALEPLFFGAKVGL